MSRGLWNLAFVIDLHAHAPSLSSFESSFSRFGLLYARMKFVAALLALCGMGVLACAQSTPPKFFPYPYTTDDLPNQLRLITVPTDNPNLVALYIIVQTGSRNENRGGQEWLRSLLRAHDVSRQRAIHPGRARRDLEARRGVGERLYQ